MFFGAPSLRPVLSLSTLACAERSRGAQDRLSRSTREACLPARQGGSDVGGDGRD